MKISSFEFVIEATACSGQQS